MPGGANEHGHAGGEHEGIGTKIKNLFRRSSTANEDKHAVDDASGGVNHSGSALTQHSSDSNSQATTAVDPVIDQTSRGEMLPTAGANAVGATNLNANAETGWPGVVNGEHLQGIVIDLRSVDKHKVSVGGGKKGEGNWVTVHVSASGSWKV